MLDSTGKDSWVDISCIFCPRTIRLATYVPESDHGGKELTGLGPYLQTSRASVGGTDDASIFSAGGTFTVFYEDRQFKVDIFHPVYDGNPYSYNNPIEPKFGFGPDKAFWVCGDCLGLLNGTDGVLRVMKKKVVLFVGLNDWAAVCKKENKEMVTVLVSGTETAHVSVEV